MIQPVNNYISVYGVSGAPKSDGSLNGASALDRIINFIKTSRLSLNKKKQLIRWVWDMFKAQGSSSGSAPVSDFEKKVYELVKTMELMEEFKMEPGELSRHIKEIDEMVKALKEKDAQDQENLDTLQEIVSQASSLRSRYLAQPAAGAQEVINSPSLLGEGILT